MALCAKGQNTIVFTPQMADQYIGKSVQIFPDSSRKLTFTEVNMQPDLFTEHLNDVPNFGVSEANNWVKFIVENQSAEDKVILNLAYPAIDNVDLYLVKEGQVDSFHIAKTQSIRERAYEHQYYLFDLPLKKGESGTVFLKLSSNKQILVPLTLNTQTSIIPALTISDTLSGLYLGIMLVMLLYNLFIYFSARDRHYLDYVHYIFWVTATQAALLGYLHKYFWTSNTWLIEHMLTFTGAMSGIATVIFAKSFLRSKHFAPKLDLVLNLIIIGDVIAIIFLGLGFPLQAYQAVNITAGLGSPFVLYTAWAIYRKNYKPAKYFLYAWSIFLASVVVFVLKDYGILPYNLFTIHAVQIGSALEAVLLSFALANKINILKQEKEASQAMALRAAEENERIIREQNVILEQKVTERTVELKEANEGLNIAMENLKQAQSQLVESEKMASLGQLTAGIAHEINNPINFVTSNVTPLRRDVDMLLEAITTIEEVGLSDASVAEKQQKIEEYKEELDFDYLKIEINHLLKGIHEGASRTAEIVKGLRIFSRVDEDDLKRADINEGLDSTLVIVNNLLEGRIQIIREYNALPLIECFPGKLNQVFLNIISNGIHAINKRHGENPGGFVKISTSAGEESISISIKDNGTGMDEKTMTKIFEPFFTTKEVGEGTGLGMSIAYNTIKKHNGKIQILSEIGEGTEFIITLPIIHKIEEIPVQ
ncbi:MAG TPA: 7TM diverse intracellular signaling domain-containing protein [Sphingobacteriaceae bacterium]